MNRQIVQEKLQLATARIPAGVDVQLAPVSSILGQIQIIGLQAEGGKTDISEVRALADQIVKPRLNSIPGIAQITSIGGAAPQLQVIVSTAKLRAFNVTLEEVSAAIQSAHVNASGGFMNVGSKGPLITVTGQAKSAVEVAKAVVRDDPVRPVLVEDVADVSFGPSTIRIGDAALNAKPGVLLTVLKQPNIDTVLLTNQINAELANIQRALPADVKIIDDVFQQAVFIHRAIGNVGEAAPKAICMPTPASTAPRRS